MSEWLSATAADLGREIQAGRCDPRDLTEAFLTAIEAHPDVGRIYSAVTVSRARTEAAAAAERARAGLRRGPLDGVPISWKDLFDSFGTATEAGTAMMAGRVPDRDAEVLRNATQAGLVCLGKTHMSEIAFSGLGVNPVTATPPNVNDAGAAPGGSSSGAAVSVAMGLAAAGIGSDTGGSVRVPAAWNDLVGFKTTHGMLSLQGTVPLAAAFDTVGPLCRSVEDAALLLGALSGQKAPDLGGATTLKSRRFVVVETIAMDNLAPEVAAGFADALDLLQDAGAEIETTEAPELTEAFALAGPLYTAEAWAAWQALIAEKGDLMFHQILARISAGQAVAAADYISGWERLRELRQIWRQRVQGYDGVLSPTVPVMPPNVARLLEDDAYFTEVNLMALRNTRIGNLMGGCGVSLPTAQPSAGVLISGLPGQDAQILRLARAAERALR